MAGRQPKKVFEYSPEGKLVKVYTNQHEYFRLHHLKHGNLYNQTSIKEKQYKIAKNGNIITDEKWRISDVLKQIEIVKSPYCNFNKTERSNLPVAVYNLENELLGIFKNPTAITKLTGISQSTIHHQLFGGTKKSKIGLSFKIVSKEMNFV